MLFCATTNFTKLIRGRWRAVAETPKQIPHGEAVRNDKGFGRRRGPLACLLVIAALGFAKCLLCGVDCGMSSTMQIVQIVLDKKLLHAADEAAKRTGRNRSALVREALREHLRRLEVRAGEERDRQGYSRHPAADDEARGWESEASWPPE